MNNPNGNLNRREALAAATGMALMWAVPGRADETSPLPLHTTGWNISA